MYFEGRHDTAHHLSIQEAHQEPRNKPGLCRACFQNKLTSPKSKQNKDQKNTKFYNTWVKTSHFP